LFKNFQTFRKNYQKTSGGKFFLAHPVDNSTNAVAGLVSYS